MAIIKPVFTRPEGDDSALLVTWPNMQNADTGEPVQFVKYADRCAQVFGTFGAGGSVDLEGSQNSSNWALLNKMQGTPMTFSAAGVGQILENTLFIRPRVTAGDGTTSLTVSALIRTATSIVRK